CLVPHSQGETTRAAFFMYTFNPDTYECQGFLYGGLGGNPNRFWSKKACEERCVIPNTT
ncbi:hypothetical protein KR067_013233, partial [Drosophila pandora]